MKKFKFRIFNIKSKKLKIDSPNYVIDSLCSLFWIFVYNDPIYCSSEDYIVSLCTGLKDKNGKEIYEGDICNDNLSECETWKNMIVNFRLGSFMMNDRCLFHFDKIEIIGNIYENHELLENK